MNQFRDSLLVFGNSHLEKTFGFINVGNTLFSLFFVLQVDGVTSSEH